MKTNDFWPRFPEKHVGREKTMEGLTICHFRYCLLKNVIALPDGPFNHKGSDFLRITLLILFYFGAIFYHSAPRPDPQTLAPSFFKTVAARDQEDWVFWPSGPLFLGSLILTHCHHFETNFLSLSTWMGLLLKSQRTAWTWMYPSFTGSFFLTTMVMNYK